MAQPYTASYRSDRKRVDEHLMSMYRRGYAKNISLEKRMQKINRFYAGGAGGGGGGD